MQNWKFSDGSVVIWNINGSIRVEGNSSFAESIRRSFGYPSDYRISVRVAFMPGGCVALDRLNIWLIDRFLRNESSRYTVAIMSSTYTPRDEDMPVKAKEIIERFRNAPPPEPGVVY